MILIMCLNWNGEKLLNKMVPSLLKNIDKLNDDVKIVIRDNGSKDNSIKFLKDYPVEILDIGHNRDSFSTGMNSIFDHINPSNNDILLLLNNDIVFNNDISLLNMLNTMKRHDAAIVGARLMYEDNTISHNGVIFSNRYGKMPWHYRDKCKVEDFDKKNRLFQAVTAACCLVKVKNYVDAGKLDNKLKWSFEDVDLNLHVSKIQKQKVICCGNTEITHITSASLKKNPVQKLNLQQNVNYFKHKWFGKYEIDHDKYLKDLNYNIIA